MRNKHHIHGKEEGLKVKSQLLNERMPREKGQSENLEDLKQLDEEYELSQTFSDKRKAYGDYSTSEWISIELRYSLTENAYEDQADIMETHIFNDSNAKKSESDEKYVPLPVNFTPVSTGAINAPPSVKATLNSAGRPLEDFTRSFMEPRLGIDLSQIRVHDDDKANESAKALDSQAFTFGSDIVFAKGKYSPGTHSGTQLLAHELTHVVQQSQPTYPSSENSIQRKDAEPTASQSDKNKLAKPEVSPEELTEMKNDVGVIVRYLKDGLNDNSKVDVLGKIKKWKKKDSEIKENTGYSGTVYLDKFILQLKITSFTQRSLRNLWIEEHLLVFDSLFYELDGYFLEDYKWFISISETQKERGPMVNRMNDIWSTIGKQELIGLWGMTKGLGMGVAGMSDTVGYAVGKQLQLLGIDAPELTSATKFIGEQFDESGKIMFGNDYNKEKLFWGLGAADIGQVGGTVIWNLAMLGKGKPGASSNAFKALQTGLGLVGNIKGIEDSVKNIIKIIDKMPRPLEFKDFVSNPYFLNEITSIAANLVGMVSGISSDKASDKIKSVITGMGFALDSAQLATLTAKIYAIISDKPEGEKVEELKDALSNLITSMATAADKGHENYKEKKLKNGIGDVEVDQEGAKPLEATETENRQEASGKGEAIQEERKKSGITDPEGAKSIDSDGPEGGEVSRRSDIGDEAHNAANYAKYLEELRAAEAANPLVESQKQTGDLPSNSPERVKKSESSAGAPSSKPTPNFIRKLFSRKNKMPCLVEHIEFPNILVDESIKGFDMKKVLKELNRTDAGAQIAEKIVAGELHLVVTKEVVLEGYQGAHVGKEISVVFDASLQQAVGTLIHEGSHFLNSDAITHELTGSRLDTEAIARAHEYEYNLLAGQPPYDGAEVAYREAYEQVLAESGDTRMAQVAAEQAMINELKADPERYGVETKKEEASRISNILDETFDNRQNKSNLEQTIPAKKPKEPEGVGHGSWYRGMLNIPASELKPLVMNNKKGNRTSEWIKARDELRKAIENGQKFQVRVESSTEAKQFLEEALGKMDRRKAHTNSARGDEVPKYTKGYEQHMELEGGYGDLRHIKFYINDTDGHVFYEIPN